MREKILSHLSTLIIWTWVFFSPTATYLVVIGCLVVADTFVGVLAAQKKGVLMNKVSRRLRPAIDKFIVYAIGVLIAYVMQVLFLTDFPAMKLVAGLIISIELKSFDENFHVVAGFSIFKVILGKLKLKQ